MRPDDTKTQNEFLVSALKARQTVRTTPADAVLGVIDRKHLARYSVTIGAPAGE